MLRSFLRHIHMQPKAVRNKYALALSGTFTSLVALVWLVTNIHGSSDTVASSQVTERASPFTSVFSELGRQLGAVKASFSGAGTTTEPVPEAPSRDPREFTLTEENRQAVTAEAVTQTSTTTPGATTTREAQPVYREVQIRTSSTTSSSGTLPIILNATTTQNQSPDS